jgi:hypothetical protein
VRVSSRIGRALLERLAAPPGEAGGGREVGRGAAVSFADGMLECTYIASPRIAPCCPAA